MQNKSSKTIFTTVSIDKETGGLVEKICKRYSLKKAEVVKLAFRYIDTQTAYTCSRKWVTNMMPTPSDFRRRIRLYRQL